MTSHQLEVGPLPPSGPTSAALVAAQLAMPAPDAHVTAATDAANSLVRDLPIADTARAAAGDPPPDTWPPRIALGATMLAARLARRRNSPDGIASFSDLGAVYVQRNDPDVAQLLQIGRFTKPVAR